MAKKTFTAEQIINMLREAEVMIAKGETSCLHHRSIPISQTFVA